VVLEQSTVSRNRNGGNAGGILAGDITLTNSRVEENSGAKAGGINAAGTATLTNSTVSNNSVTSAGGAGGIISVIGLTLTNSTVSGNTGTDGGALNVSRQATLTGSTISNNSSTTSGGGIRLADGATLALTNSTLSSNTAQTGGGIAQDGTATLRLTNSTIANNTAGTNGSGIYKLGGTAEFRNMIVANNTGSPNCFFATPVTTLGNNLATDGSCAFSGPNDRNGADAKLGPLANNGGPTKTHALLSGSPAIDFGNPDGCPATDQRGVTRPQDGDGNPPASCDIGAFEAATGSSPPPSSCSPRPPVTVTSTPDGAGRLRVTVSTTGVGGALSVLRFGAASNAQIDAPGGPPNATGNFEVSPPAGATTYTFTVRRVTAGQGVQVPFTTVDACGLWPTFVGGGPSAF
jgi:predicted outer membrane repeat protein